MTQFLSLLLNGVSLGAIYALIALGFVIIFKASEVVSFTQGSLLLLGAYTIARLSDPLGFWLAALAGIVVTALAALIVERLIINRLRGAPVISLAIVTIGVDIILLTELIRRIGSDILNVPHPWGGKSFRIGEVGISQNRLIATIVAGAADRDLLRGVQVLELGRRDARLGRGRRDRGADGHPAGPGLRPRLGGRRRARRGRRAVPGRRTRRPA